MYTMAFIGPSGTGKSHRSVTIANEMEADAIIDDGLLIARNKVLAGYSAKKEPTKLAAVRRALFTRKEDIEDVKSAIKKYNLERIMILGTSLAMAERIAAQLEIEPISKIIHIEDVATPQEMQEAVRMRTKEGKHVIPVPVFEIKQDFSGYFLHPLRQIKKSLGKTYSPPEDKSIVRPTFSYMGQYTISDSVVSHIAAYETQKFDEVTKVNSVLVNNSLEGAQISLNITMKYGCIIPKIIPRIQNAVIKSVDYHTSVNVIKVDIFVKKVIIK